MFCSYVHVNKDQANFLENGRRMKNYPQNQETPKWRPWWGKNPIEEQSKDLKIEIIKITWLLWG